MNFNEQLKEIISKIDINNKPRLLLHACCAPCSSYCVEYLNEYFDITILYYNPNIESQEEFDKRFEEFEKIQQSIAAVKVVKIDYNMNEFYDKISGLEKCSEGGKRCFVCYRLRLEKTAQYASENKFDYFASTLSISPHKNAEILNEIGLDLEKIYNIKHLPNDFKKGGGFLKSTVLSKELDLYRQDYCGCIFSKLEREVSKNQKFVPKMKH